MFHGVRETKSCWKHKEKSLDPSPSHSQKAAVKFCILNVSSFQQYLATVSKKISSIFDRQAYRRQKYPSLQGQQQRIFRCRGKSAEGKGNDTRELKDVIVRGGREGNKEMCFKD